jgi:3-methyladenine DNA glycosylase AlkD
MAAPTLARAVLDRLTERYPRAADPERALAMRAYLRNQFAFLGIGTQQRRALSRRVLAGLPRPDEDDLRATALACWALAEREYQYFACDWLRANARVCTPAFLGTARTLLTDRAWWDTVDVLAVHLVGSIVARHPAAVSTMDDWAGDPDRWLVRTAILHQLRYRDRTDEARLLRYCLAQAGSTDFFVRKAIGWALREYARTSPDAVRGFVTAHAGELSGLSVREALRHLGPEATG